MNTITNQYPLGATVVVMGTNLVGTVVEFASVKCEVDDGWIEVWVYDVEFWDGSRADFFESELEP